MNDITDDGLGFQHQQHTGMWNTDETEQNTRAVISYADPLYLNVLRENKKNRYTYNF